MTYSGNAPAASPARLRPGRGRRRAADVRRAVLAAAGELLFDAGLAAVTFDKVAARSGASKVTLYKWWPSPGALALEAYFATTEQTLAFPDTGDIEQDLLTQLQSFVGLLTGRDGGPVIAELIGAAQTDPDLAAALSKSYVRPRRQLAVDRLAIARDQGQIRPDADLEVIVDQLWGACYHRLLLPVPDQPLTTAFASALVRNLMDGIHPRLPAQQPRQDSTSGGKRPRSAARRGRPS
jgi:AcrR family transcriptional regulator